MLLKTIDEIKDVVSVVYTRNRKMIDEYIDSLYEDDRYTLIRVAHAIYDIFDEEIYQELAKSGIKRVRGYSSRRGRCHNSRGIDSVNQL